MQLDLYGKLMRVRNYELGNDNSREEKYMFAIVRCFYDGSVSLRIDYNEGTRNKSRILDMRRVE